MIPIDTRWEDTNHTGRRPLRTAHTHTHKTNDLRKRQGNLYDGVQTETTGQGMDPTNTWFDVHELLVAGEPRASEEIREYSAGRSIPKFSPVIVSKAPPTLPYEFGEMPSNTGGA
jgi:hypothetical protein